MRRTLLSGRHLAVIVSRYGPGARQTMHRDRHSRLSLLLRGGFREDGPSGSLEIGAGAILMKSQTVPHEDQFSSEGALLLTVEFDDQADGLSRVDAGCWRTGADIAAMRLGSALLEGALAKDEAGVDAACADLLVEEPEPAARRSPAPAWLVRLKEETETSSLAQIDIAARAREAGVHPAHASRLFRRCFGVSVTEHALINGVRRAIQEMSRPGASLSQAALAAGFYDQSHMNRTFRRISGRSPGAHRRLVERAILLAGG